MANKGKTNKRLSEVDAPSKASKRLQRATRSPAEYSTLASQRATGSPADQTAPAGRADHCELQSFTHNSPTEAVTDLPSDEESSTEDPQLRTPKPTVKSPSVAYTDPGPRKFQKRASPSERQVRNTRPPHDKTWEVFGDSGLAEYLSAATTIEQYHIACYYFHCRLALVARGFHLNELQAIFKVTMPNFIREGCDADRKHCARVFEGAYNWVEDQLVARLRAYAELWLKSEGGKEYRVRETRAM